MGWGLHRPDLLAGFERHGGDPFARDEHEVEGLGGSDFRADVAEFGEVFKLFEEGFALGLALLLGLPFCGDCLVVHSGQEGHLLFARELGNVLAVLLLAAPHEVGETIHDDFLVPGVETIFDDDFDPAGDACFNGARGVGLGNDGLGDHGDLFPLGRSEEIEFGGIEGIPEFGKGAFWHGHCGPDRCAHHFKKFSAFHGVFE